ncbi:MAG: FHA domain-containing protein [Rhodocyclaceae bacterium]|nr:FHA domain-containing protein [Rhodocyclaceae bacterium]
MAKLILCMESLVLKEIPLNKERMTIGRKPHNDIQIDNLAISGEHAVVVTILNDSFLEDLHSTNGTFINGHAVEKHFLQNGDVIELGKYRLKYVNEVPQQQAAPADFEKTMVLRPDMARQTASQIENKVMGDTQVGLKLPPGGAAVPPPAPAAQAPAVPRAAIQIVSGANVGKELELTKTLTTLGKPGVQVAVIARRPQGYFITHVEGANFPIVSGVTLTANKPHPLKDHDIIELAGVKMEFFLKA